MAEDSTPSAGTGSDPGAIFEKNSIAGAAREEVVDVPGVSPPRIPMVGARPRARGRRGGFWTWYYRALFRLKGIRFGRNLLVRGPLLLRLDGDPRNISIGDDVTLMPGVDLKIRENGKIILHNGVLLDTGVRLVAANDARIELGESVALGYGTILNAGADILIGRGTIAAGYCYISVSDHEHAAGTPIVEQPFIHSPAYIGEGVWLGASVYVARGSRIGAGAVIGAQSFVRGVIPENAIAVGTPARVVKYRT